ncbi:MAG: transposase [bacterium]|nr:transposase [bacterium]
MTTINDIFNAYAPKYLEHFPNLPLAHRKALSAICNCRSGHYGHSLYQCQSCGAKHRVHHACGNRHCPQCQHHKTRLWLHNQLAKQLPAPHFLITFTVPETLRPFIRSHQRIAYQAMFKASSTALKRLAKDARFIATDLPGFTGVLHTWGRQLQYHPHIHYIVPGGGLAKDRAEWRPSRANFFVPVKALSPIYRAIFKQEMQHAGLIERIDSQVWNIDWNVNSQANPTGAASFKYLAPYVFKVAISNSRIVSLNDRTVTFTYRKPGSGRQPTTNLDVLEFIRRFLQHVLPDGLMKVRHFGFMNASCAIKIDIIRLMIVKQYAIAFKPTHLADPTPFVAACPTCGAQMQLVMRLWTASRAFLDTG